MCDVFKWLCVCVCVCGECVVSVKVCLSVCLSVYLSICLPAFLCVRVCSLCVCTLEYTLAGSKVSFISKRAHCSNPRTPRVDATAMHSPSEPQRLQLRHRMLLVIARRRQLRERYLRVRHVFGRLGVSCELVVSEELALLRTGRPSPVYYGGERGRHSVRPIGDGQGHPRATWRSGPTERTAQRTVETATTRRLLRDAERAERVVLAATLALGPAPGGVSGHSNDEE